MIKLSLHDNGKAIIQEFNSVVWDQRLKFRVPKLKFQVLRLKFRVPRLKFRVLRLKFRVPRLKFRVPRLKFRVPRLKFRVPRLKFRVPRLEFRVLRLKFRVPRLEFCVLMAIAKPSSIIDTLPFIKRGILASSGDPKCPKDESIQQHPRLLYPQQAYTGCPTAKQYFATHSETGSSLAARLCLCCGLSNSTITDE
jgi:hypothetical protein